MLVIYVDDLGIAAPSKAIIDDFIAKLRERGFELTQEESFSEYLGIKFSKHDDGSLEMTQKGLIEKILKTAGMENCNPNHTPAILTALGDDPKGPQMEESWNYRVKITSAIARIGWIN